MRRKDRNKTSGNRIELKAVTVRMAQQMIVELEEDAEKIKEEMARVLR